MHITQLRLNHFRNFTETRINPSASFNMIYGLNGAGKSSILEAIHLLGYGRSFRTNKANTIIQTDALSATSFCKFQAQDGEQVLGASRSKADGFVFNINAEKTRRISDIAKILPIQIFTPQSSDLILGAPMLRRRFIDWLVFHVEQSFIQSSKAFSSALEQRNALLKMSFGKPVSWFSQQDVWSTIITKHGEIISQHRKHYLNALNGQLKALYREFKPDVEIELRYNLGWDSGCRLEEAIDGRLDKDIARGNTSSGPHKADIQFLVNGKSASEYLSRGQLRVLVSLLLVAQVRLLKQCTGKSCIFLVDDIAAELDVGTREFFLDTIVAENAQVFVTAIEKQQLSFAEKYNNKKVFHVKHDHVNEE
ncbi:DNA replication/repair protein RecF [Glaciecola siphonariae]|uniref:DNA replication and repair protein RecF n=1 Tax=Glaciecola siphonariae TaxID=521012 RepID=A0ABV9LSI8_9ALTE